jgi:hypothetical protein
MGYRSRRGQAAFCHAQVAAVAGAGNSLVPQDEEEPRDREGSVMIIVEILKLKWRVWRLKLEARS